MNKKITLIFILFCCIGLVAKSQTITLTSSPSGVYCAGSSLVVSFTVSGSVWYSDNKFIVQLSSASGSFTTPSDVGTIAGQGNGSIVAVVPKTSTVGANYKVRIVSTNSPQTSNESNVFAINGIPNAPAVSSPVNYTQCASASSLSATALTGNTLLWLDATNYNIGGTESYSTSTYLERLYNNKTTVFSTLRSNVTITSIDYTIPANRAVSGLTLGIYNSSGTLIATSTTITNLNNNTALPVKITSVFNFLITNPGSYSVGVADGTGNVGSQDPLPIFPITESTNSINITNVTNGARIFNNIIFNLGIASSTPPIPTTTTVGSKVYFVKQQNANGCISDATPITVNISALAKPTVTTPITYTQFFASPSALVATPSPGATLYWSNTINGTYTTTPIVPSTTVMGSSTYFVKQMLGSCLSSAESIVVNITAMAPPTVASPVNYCLNAAAIPLTATPTVSGATLNWYTGSTTTGSIGPLTSLGGSDNAFGDNFNNKLLKFTTIKPFLNVVSIDYYLNTYQTVTDLILGIYDSFGNLLSTSTTTTSIQAGNSILKITNQFNYVIEKAGNYVIKVKSGAGQVALENPVGTYPIYESPNTNSLTLTDAVSSDNSKKRIFFNLVFKGTSSSTTPPTPLTNVAGTTSYYVSQSYSGVESPPAKIDVAVSNISAPTVTGTPASRCGPGTVTLSSVISAGTANWYANSTGGTALGTGLTFITPNITSTTTFYVDASNGCTSARTPVVATINNANTWKGTTNTLWSTASNWECGVVPASGSPVIISNVTNKPVLVGDITIGDLTLAAGAKISLNGNGLTITRQLGTGVISSTPASSLIVTGNTDLKFDQTTPGTTNSLRNFTVNSLGSTVTLSNDLNVFEQVNVTAGALASGVGLLTLKSSETLTAYVSPITTANSVITGDIKVERFMKGGSNARRSYRLMSSPTGNGSTYTISGLQANTLITGAGGVANGFDVSPANGATIYHYKESNTGPASLADYTPIPSVAGGIFNIGEGMYVYNRGNRNLTDALGVSKFVSTAIPEDNTLTFSGRLNQGQIIIPVSFTLSSPANNVDGFNLVGNPYASTINVASSSFVTNNPNYTTFYVLDPVTKNFSSYLRTGVNAGSGTGYATNFIASGQGFFVKTTAAKQPITFDENDKVSLQPLGLNLLMGLDAAPKNLPAQFLKIKMINPVDSTAQDDIVLNFNSNSKTTYQVEEDAFDLGGNGTTFLSSMSSDQVRLAINSLPSITENLRVALVANSTVSGDFNMDASNVGSIDKIWNIFLVDHYKADSVKLNLTPKYSFKVERAIPTTYAPSRFEIIFREKESLLATLLSFSGDTASYAANLSWKPSLAAKYDVVFTLQRSTDGINFTDIYTVQSDQRSIYNYKDQKPGLGVFYYRLKQEDVNTHKSVTNSIELTITRRSSANNFVIYPNPVGGNYTIDLGIEGVSEIKVRLLSVNGRVMQRYVVNTQSWTRDASQLATGTYIIELVNGKTNKLIGRSKFLKR